MAVPCVTYSVKSDRESSYLANHAFRLCGALNHYQLSKCLISYCSLLALNTQLHILQHSVKVISQNTFFQLQRGQDITHNLKKNQTVTPLITHVIRILSIILLSFARVCKYSNDRLLSVRLKHPVINVSAYFKSLDQTGIIQEFSNCAYLLSNISNQTFHKPYSDAGFHKSASD